MSKLDDYISKLMSDDKALENFLVDPIRAAQDDNGLSKGQRSVLRRVTAGISTNSTNGYALERTNDSYRRSLRLLQNVLHTHTGNAIAHHNGDSGDLAGAATGHYIIVYFGSNPQNPGFNPYSNYVYTYASENTGNNTVGGAMANASKWYFRNGNPATVSFGTDPTRQYILSFTINGVTYRAVPGDRSTSTNPFWFYSINGQAIIPTGAYGYDGYVNPYAAYGDDGQSFKNFPLTNYPNQTIFWQCIAPDVRYGFAPCVSNTF